MRLVKAFQFLVLLFLGLALLGAEVVESACFVNDVSNDYVQASVPDPPAPQAPNRAAPVVIAQRSINLAQGSSLNPAVIPSLELSRSAAADLLRLLSIQRE
jgi:hypothetical protein